MSKRTVVISVPEVASITVTGPVQCGKSIVIDRIKKMLEAEFDATVVSKDWEREGRGVHYEYLDSWELKMVSRTIWHLSEPLEEQDNES